MLINQASEASRRMLGEVDPAFVIRALAEIGASLARQVSTGYTRAAPPAPPRKGKTMPAPLGIELEKITGNG